MVLTVGELIKKCKESLCTQLMQLEGSYEPCDMDAANLYLVLADKYTEDLIQRLNRVTESFVENVESQYKNNVIDDDENDITNGNELVQIAENAANGILQEQNETQSATESVHVTNNQQTIEMNGSPVVGTSAGSKTSKGIRCEVCRTRFRLTSFLIHHRRAHFNQHSIYCRVCFHIFENKLAKLKHENKCHQKRYECFVCKANQTSQARMKIHMRVHSGIKPFSCSKCKVQRFTQLGDRNRHEKNCKKNEKFLPVS